MLKLPEPKIDLNAPLMKAIKNRKSTRRFTEDDVTIDELSNILYCAAGQTKKATKRVKSKRVIASACNGQKVHVLVAWRGRVYRYDERDHVLIEVVDKCINEEIVNQKMLKNNKLGLIYIANQCMTSGVYRTSESEFNLLVGTEVGAMSQNVSLYCAVNQLGTVLVGLMDRSKIGKIVNLSDEKVLYTQVIGHLK